MIGFYDRVFIFLPRSKPDRGTGQKTDNPCPVRGEKIELKNPPVFEILPRFSSGPSPTENYKFPFEIFLRLQVKRKWSKTTIQYKTYSIYKNIVSLGWNPHRCTYDRNKFNGALGLGLLLTIYICIIRCILPPLYLNGHASQGHNGRGRKCTSM